MQSGYPWNQSDDDYIPYRIASRAAHCRTDTWYICAIFSCYYTSTNCKYFFDRECYENSTSGHSASACDSVLGGYFLNGRCYYNAPQNCTDGYYRQCTCYPHRSSTYTNGTCINIGGYYAAGYCYYDQFNCRRYAVNGQCYRLVASVSSSFLPCTHFATSSLLHVHFISSQFNNVGSIVLFGRRGGRWKRCAEA